VKSSQVVWLWSSRTKSTWRHFSLKLCHTTSPSNWYQRSWHTSRPIALEWSRWLSDECHLTSY